MDTVAFLVEYLVDHGDSYNYRVHFHAVRGECCHEEKVSRTSDLQFSFLGRELLYSSQVHVATF